MKPPAFIPIIFVMAFATFSCGEKKTEPEKRYSGTQSFEVVPGDGVVRDTINKTDFNGMKQGQWIVFLYDKLQPLEKGNYVNNQKEGDWIYYGDSGKVAWTVTYKADRAVHRKFK